MVTSRPGTALGLAVGLHVGRLVVILGVLAAAPVVGVTGWWAGLAANVGCCLYAAVVLTVLGRWRRTGLTLRGSWAAVPWLLPLVGEALAWLLPDGVAPSPPGYGWWAATLLLVGLNEELLSRGTVLPLLRDALPDRVAVLLTGALFGLQHLSLLLTGPTSLSDTLVIVLEATVYGTALAAHHARFGWLTPLVLVHALSNWAGILSPGAPPGWVRIGADLLLLATAVALMRAHPAPPGVTGRAASAWPRTPGGPRGT